MRHRSVVLVLSLLAAPAVAGPREALELPAGPPHGAGAHDVVEAARLGLAAAVQARYVDPKVLRAERVKVNDEPLWRVDIAGRFEPDSCAAMATWISEKGEVVRYSQYVQADREGHDCRAWYFDGDAIAANTVRDFANPDAWQDPVWWGNGELDPGYTSYDEGWGLPGDEWDQWREETYRRALKDWEIPCTPIDDDADSTPCGD